MRAVAGVAPILAVWTVSFGWPSPHLMTPLPHLPLQCLSCSSWQCEGLVCVGTRLHAPCWPPTLCAIIPHGPGAVPVILLPAVKPLLRSRPFAPAGV